MPFTCRVCRRDDFRTRQELHEHSEAKHRNQYCIACCRLFVNPNACQQHLLTSSAHNKKTVSCPARACEGLFISNRDLALHLESGACPGGVSRDRLDRLVARVDKLRVITLPGMETCDNGPSVGSVSDAASGSGSRTSPYECSNCGTPFKSFGQLRSHEDGPAHAAVRYQCPPRRGGCEQQFKTLSGLLAHVQSTKCTVSNRFKKQFVHVIPPKYPRSLISLCRYFLS
ncbi:hypothetical protein BC629DRAFT_191473 [Irpex lacteus]|nr:hypothetical protein BC629DRAFT_191473 [Irpex lacteus]